MGGVKEKESPEANGVASLKVALGGLWGCVWGVPFPYLGLHTDTEGLPLAASQSLLTVKSHAFNRGSVMPNLPCI